MFLILILFFFGSVCFGAENDSLKTNNDPRWYDTTYIFVEFFDNKDFTNFDTNKYYQRISFDVYEYNKKPTIDSGWTAMLIFSDSLEASGASVTNPLALKSQTIFKIKLIGLVARKKYLNVVYNYILENPKDFALYKYIPKIDDYLVVIYSLKDSVSYDKFWPRPAPQN